MKCPDWIYDRQSDSGQLNEVLWLSPIAEHHRSHFFNEAESFNHMVWRGRLAEHRRNILGHIHRLIEAYDNSQS